MPAPFCQSHPSHVFVSNALLATLLVEQAHPVSIPVCTPGIALLAANLVMVPP